MTLAQKMLAQNGITPSESTDTQDQDPSQTGNDAGSPEIGGDQNLPAAAKAEGANISTPPAEPGRSSEPNEPDEAAILKMLEKKGIKIASLSALTANPSETPLTTEQKEAIEQQRQNDIRTYALQTGKVTSTQLDNYIRESSTPDKELAFNLYAQERIAEETEAKTAEDDLPTEADLRYEFNELYFQHADATDPKRKAAEKRLKKTVEDHLQTKYDKIYSLEDDYTTYQETAQQRKRYEGEVAGAIASISEKLEFEITDDKQKIKYPVKLTAEDIKEISSLYTGDDMFNSIGGKAKKEDLTQAITNSLVAKNLTRIISDVSNAHAAAKIKAMKLGRREIFSTTETGDSDKKETRPMVKKVLEANKPN